MHLFFQQQTFTELLICVMSLFEALMLSHSVVSNSVTPWTVAHQAPLSMGFSKQEY